MSITSTNDAISAAQTILGAIQEEAGIAHMITERDPRVAKLPSFDRQNVMRTQLVKHAWQKIGRQVLAMHPAIVDEVRVAGSDQIPGDILRVLPYMNPLVVFADPPVFKSWLRPGEAHRLTGRPESTMRLLGFFTYGSRQVRVDETTNLDNGVTTTGVRVEQRIYPTNAPEADRFGMMLVLEAIDEHGKVIDLEFNSMTLHLDRTATLSEIVEELMGRYHWDANNARDLGLDQRLDPRNDKQHRKWMRDVLSVVIGSLFYLCSTTLEAQPVPRKAVARRLDARIVRKPFSLYQVGWTTGAALTRYRQQRLSGWKDSEQTDIGHQRDPEHRRSHFKMQPYGPQNSLRKLIFVSAYWTHVERLGEMGVNTARAVPQVDGRGSTRQSVQTALKTRS